jgi:glycolate oxidase FAD binding subunit
MRTGGRILIRGSGTAGDWGGAPGAVDTVLDTSGLSRLLAYNPADMTVAVQAGMPLRQLQQHLADHGQWIANDAARVPAGATVGGLLATADAGPSQHRYGPLRDLVLGATLVLADGTIAHSGGHVIKNVAGYDLARLFSGSYGTLALLAEVVLRVHPRPPSSRTLTVPADARTAHRMATELRDRPIDPTAVTWTGGRLLVRFTGTETGIVPQLDRAGLPAAEVLDGAGEQAAWDADTALVSGMPKRTIFRVGALPSRFPDLVELVDKVATGNGVAAEWSSALGVGIHTIALQGGDAAAHAAVLTGVRNEFAGAAVTLHRRVDGVDSLIDGWGPPPPAVSVMRAVKHAFDPDDRLGPDRYFPWLEGNK